MTFMIRGVSTCHDRYALSFDPAISKIKPKKLAAVIYIERRGSILRISRRFLLFGEAVSRCKILRIEKRSDG